MIHESYYWKADLAKNSDYLTKRLSAKRWDERSFVRLEKVIMISLYSIRKLYESDKLPPTLMKTEIELEKYRFRGEFIDHLRWHKFDEDYELGKKEECKMPLDFVINQFVHSFIFIPSFGERNNLEGILFNSDKTKNKYLFYVRINDVIDIINMVAHGVMSSLRYEWVNGERRLVEGKYKTDVL